MGLKKVVAQFRKFSETFEILPPTYVILRHTFSFTNDSENFAMKMVKCQASYLSAEIITVSDR